MDYKLHDEIQFFKKSTCMLEIQRQWMHLSVFSTNGEIYDSIIISRDVLFFATMTQ